MVELHRWLSRSDDLDHPDLMVIDLDPPRRPDLATLRRAARATRDLLGEIGLTPYLMTTGSRGYHVVAPLDRTAGFDDVRGLARAVAERLAAAAPDALTTEQRIAKRGNRIYLDVGRNAYAPDRRRALPPARPSRGAGRHPDRVHRARPGRARRGTTPSRSSDAWPARPTRGPRWPRMPGPPPGPAPRSGSSPAHASNCTRAISAHSGPNISRRTRLCSASRS